MAKKLLPEVVLPAMPASPVNTNNYKVARELRKAMREQQNIELLKMIFNNPIVELIGFELLVQQLYQAGYLGVGVAGWVNNQTLQLGIIGIITAQQLQPLIQSVGQSAGDISSIMSLIKGI